MFESAFNRFENRHEKIRKQFVCQMSPQHHSEIAAFLDQVEKYSKRSFFFRDELSLLLEIVSLNGKESVFADLIFQAKFAVKTREVMKRIGQEADGFEKLATEFQSSVTQSIDLLRKLVEGDKEEDEFGRKFLSVEPNSFERFMELLTDLNCIKNWQIDGKPLPYEEKSLAILNTHNRTGYNSTDKNQEEHLTILLSRIQRSAVLGWILFALFLLIDPPVTILGWILSLGITALLVNIVIQIFFLTKNPNSN
jgi:hypothetical protein